MFGWDSGPLSRARQRANRRQAFSSTLSAGSSDAESLALFRAGAWVENMKLAAAAGDKDALRQVTTAQYVRREMQNLHAPQGILEALEQLSHTVVKSELTQNDIAKVLTLA